MTGKTALRLVLRPINLPLAWKILTNVWHILYNKYANKSSDSDHTWKESNMKDYDFTCLQTIIGQSVRMPHDSVDPASLHGPCRVYQLGRPMPLAQLNALPADLQRRYLRRLRQRGGSEEAVKRMLGAAPEDMRRLRARYHISFDCPDAARWASFCSQERRER